MKSVMIPKWAGLVFGILKAKAAPSNVQAMWGNVNKSSDRLPKVSMVRTAGHAKLSLCQFWLDLRAEMKCLHEIDKPKTP